MCLGYVLRPLYGRFLRPISAYFLHLNLLSLISVAAVGGAAAGMAMGSGGVMWPVVGGAAVVVAMLGYGRAWRGWPVVFFFLAAGAGAMRAESSRRAVLAEVARQGGRLAGTFVVSDSPQVRLGRADGARWVTFATTFAAGGLKVVFCANATNDLPQAGETWSCAGWLTPSCSPNLPSRLFISGRHTFARRLSSPSSLALLRASLSRRISLGLADRPLAASLLRAMLLGQRTALPPSLRASFRSSGTLHVFAISGLHVMALASLLALLLSPLPSRFVPLATLPLLWLYVLMISSPPSAVRAAAMASVYALAPLFWRKPNMLTAWQLTLLAFVLLDPLAFFSVGSLLSFTVMLGIILFLRWARSFSSPTLFLLGVPFSAWAASVPLVAYFFSRITPGGLLANLAMVPMALLAVMTSALGLAASFISDTLAAHLNNAAALFTDGMVGLSWLVARLPASDLPTRPWPPWACAAWYAGLILLFLGLSALWRRTRRDRRL